MIGTLPAAVYQFPKPQFRNFPAIFLQFPQFSALFSESLRYQSPPLLLFFLLIFNAFSTPPFSFVHDSMRSGVNPPFQWGVPPPSRIPQAPGATPVAPSEGFARLTRILMRVAAEHCGERLALFLEGGYAQAPPPHHSSAPPPTLGKRGTGASEWLWRCWLFPCQGTSAR